MNKSGVRILLVGAAGRMGQTIVDLAKSDSELKIVARCDLGDPIDVAMKQCDVAIDFSQADAVKEVCRVALEQKRALVIGTTGHSPDQRQVIEKAAESLAIVFASNFSVGVNILFWLAGRVAELLGKDFAPEIVERHHKTKKDAPSGTAKTLREIVSRAGKIQNQIPIQSIREGDIVGDHMIIFRGPAETIELTHRAESREIFARGALQAAKWIVDRPPGLYSMQDVLGL